MGNKRKRNKQCACGSGKLFRDCHMLINSSTLTNDQVVPHTPLVYQDRPSTSTDTLQPPIDFIKAYEQSQETRNTQGKAILEKLIRKEISTDNLSALMTIGATSLLPENQSMELRFLPIAQETANLSSFGNIEYVNLKKVYKGYDKYFGSQSEMIEIDTQQQLYISWVKYKDNYYQILTSTFGDGEVYLQNMIWKYESIQTIVANAMSGIDATLTWVLKKVDTFIEEAGLDQYAQSNGADYKHTNIHLDGRIKDIVKNLSSSFVIKKLELPEEISKTLAKISKKPENFKDGSVDFYVSPVIDYGSHYVIPFPQLLFIALLQSVFDEIPEVVDKIALRKQFALGIKTRIAQTLKIFFGHEKVLEDLTLDGNKWSDFCIKYDGKLIFISIEVEVEGENISDAVTESTKRIFTFRNNYIQDNSLQIKSHNGVTDFFPNGIEPLEPVVLTLIDSLSENIMIGMGDLGEEALHDVINVSGFEYIIHQLTSPIEFIRYLRAVDDLRKRKIRMPGATALDLFAMYIEGNHQLREIEQDPDMLMIDFSSGAHLITENIRKKRKSTKLVQMGDKKYYMNKHWDNFYGRLSSGYMYLYRLDVSPTVLIRVPLSPDGTSNELRHSVYISFDSLCYFLDQKYDMIQAALPKSIKSIDIEVIPEPSLKERVVMGCTVNKDGTALVIININEKAHELFIGDDNSGERTIVHLFAEAIGVDKPETWIDIAMPVSTKRNFQTNTYSLGHKSYENAPRPISIKEGDRWWVDGVLSSAILDAGIKPGSYTDSDEIGELATKIAEISKQKLLETLSRYSRQVIIERSYSGLEAIYAAEERGKFETLADIAINDDAEIIAKHNRKSQDFTQLSFAHRYVLEAALQSDTEGDESLTKESFLEILSLAERYVDVEFWGDTTFLGLQPGELYISKRGYPSIASTGDCGGILSRKRTLAGLKSAKYKSDAKKQLEEDGVREPGDNEITLYHTLNKPFKDEFGYSLEDFITSGKAIIDLFSSFDSPVMIISRTILKDKLSLDTKIDKETTAKIIQSLILSKGILQDVDINPSQRFWREERLTNKPLVALPLNENMLMFTLATVERTFLSFLDRLMSGRLDYIKNNPKSDLSKAIMDIVNKDAYAFEDIVCNAVEEKGLIVKRRCTSIADVAIPRVGIGEIDGLAWSNKKKRLYVLEIKNSDPARSPVEIKSEMDNYYGRGKKKGYYSQLSRKYEWVKNNEPLIRKQFSIDSKIKLSFKPALVTNAIIASSILKKPPHPTLTLDEFIETL